MHLLDNHQARDRLRWADTTEGSLVQQISTDGRPHESTMDHLDALEAQSIYIFREAFARLKKLALLWSLGKDSNVMIWLARKAFFGRVPFPALHVDTGKKFPEMYAFRDRYGKEWELDLKIEPCPPLETIDPTLPPAARSDRWFPAAGRVRSSDQAPIPCRSGRETRTSREISCRYRRGERGTARGRKTPCAPARS